MTDVINLWDTHMRTFWPVYSPTCLSFYPLTCLLVYPLIYFISICRPVYPCLYTRVVLSTCLHVQICPCLFTCPKLIGMVLKHSLCISFHPPFFPLVDLSVHWPSAIWTVRRYVCFWTCIPKDRYFSCRVKSGNFGHQVNSDTHLQTVEIQMRRLRLIRIFTVCLVNLFCYSNNLSMKQTRSLSVFTWCPKLPDFSLQTKLGTYIK